MDPMGTCWFTSTLRQKQTFTLKLAELEPVSRADDNSFYLSTITDQNYNSPSMHVKLPEKKRGKKNGPGNSAGDLFGMVKKWPFQRLGELQLGDKKMNLNHLGSNIWQTDPFDQSLVTKDPTENVTLVLEVGVMVTFPWFFKYIIPPREQQNRQFFELFPKTLVFAIKVKFNLPVKLGGSGFLQGKTDTIRTTHWFFGWHPVSFPSSLWLHFCMAKVCATKNHHNTHHQSVEHIP